jgi:hypothetical protein
MPRAVSTSCAVLLSPAWARWSLLALHMQPVHAGPGALTERIRGGCDTHPRPCALEHKIELALIIGLFSPSQALDGELTHFVGCGHQTCSRSGIDKGALITAIGENWFPFGGQDMQLRSPVCCTRKGGWRSQMDRPVRRSRDVVVTYREFSEGSGGRMAEFEASGARTSRSARPARHWSGDSRYPRRS